MKTLFIPDKKFSWHDLWSPKQIYILNNFVTVVQEISRNTLKNLHLIYKLVSLFPFICSYLKKYAKVTTQNNTSNEIENMQ
jgi:hypothetical protein